MRQKKHSDGTTAIIAPDALIPALTSELGNRKVDFGRLIEEGVHPNITLVRSVDAKGLEFKNVVIVEPADIVNERPSGLRVLYVAMTRPLSRLRIIHAELLPTQMSVPDIKRRIEMIDLRSQLSPPEITPPSEETDTESGHAEL